MKNERTGINVAIPFSWLSTHREKKGGRESFCILTPLPAAFSAGLSAAATTPIAAASLWPPSMTPPRKVTPLGIFLILRHDSAISPLLFGSCVFDDRLSCRWLGFFSWTISRLLRSLPRVRVFDRLTQFLAKTHCCAAPHCILKHLECDAHTALFWFDPRRNLLRHR